VESLYQTDEAANGITGNGDTVTDAFTPAHTGPVPYTFKHDGKRNFIAHLICSCGEDIPVNEIGTVEGSVVVKFEKGPCLWRVQADGNWSLNPK
ncbi:hypothetical protein SE17_12585, partial [Kouleothrix aurantiaca]